MRDTVDQYMQLVKETSAPVGPSLKDIHEHNAKTDRLEALAEGILKDPAISEKLAGHMRFNPDPRIQCHVAIHIHRFTDDEGLRAEAYRKLQKLSSQGVFNAWAYIEGNRPENQLEPGPVL